MEVEIFVSRLFKFYDVLRVFVFLFILNYYEMFIFIIVVMLKLFFRSWI